MWQFIAIVAASPKLAASCTGMAKIVRCRSPSKSLYAAGTFTTVWSPVLRCLKSGRRDLRRARTLGREAGLDCSRRRLRNSRKAQLEARPLLRMERSRVLITLIT